MIYIVHPANKELDFNLPIYRRIVYNILGSSSIISKAQMDNINRWRSYIVALAKANQRSIYVNGDAAEKKVSLTFDDGPDSSITPKILDVLKENSVIANFFFIGQQISYFPKIVKRAYDEGHLILNHSWSHPYFTKITVDKVRKEVISTETKIEEVIGKKPALVRPPYGDINETVVNTINETNNKTIIWSLDSMDWLRNSSVQDIVKNIFANVRQGDIILMHSSAGHNTDIAALQEIINGLKKMEFSFVDLATLLNLKPYK